MAATMPDLNPCGRHVRLLGVASLVYVCGQAVLFGLSLKHPGAVVEEPGQIERDVAKLGGPCMAVQQYELDKYGPVRIGKCWVHYTNPTETAAMVIFHIFPGMQWLSVTAETKTDGGPLASLNWRVIQTKEIPWYDAKVT